VQDAVLTFPRVLPTALMEQTNNVSTPLVQKVATWSGVYDQNELTTYLDTLELQLVLNNVSEPVAFTLYSSNHAITISFGFPPPHWRLVDANHLDLLDKDMTTNELAQQIMLGFSKNGITTFSTEVYVTNAIAEQVKSTISACQKDTTWQDIHAVKPENVKKKDSFNASWLSTATQNRDTKLVEDLLEKKADVNLARIDGATSLIIASQSGSIEIVRVLCEAKADVNLTTNGITPLCVAAAAGNIEIVDYLLQKQAGTDLHHLPANRITPLYMAAQEGHEAIVELLLDQKGVSCEKSIQASVDHLMLVAMMNGRKTQVEELFRKKGITKKTLENFSPLHAAVFFGHLETAKVLLSKGKANPNAETENNISAFEFAEAMGYTAIYELLKKEIIVSVKKNESQKQPFFSEMKVEAKNDQDYLLLKARLTKMETNDSNQELVLLKQIVSVYENTQGKLPIKECLAKVIQDPEMNRIYQTIAKNDDFIEVIKREISKPM
jgi:ankyrin repeat protein